MESIDYLQMRTTNINIRISPLLKSSLIERGASMGLTLSDYILHILTKNISQQETELNAARATISSLEKKVKEREQELQEIENLVKPFSNLIGQQMNMNGKPYLIKRWFDILVLLAQTFKLR